jgi:spore coat protein U-like protein
MSGQAWRLALRLLLVLGAALASPLAAAAIGCSITASPATFTGIYSNTANLDVLGAFTVNCTRDPATDPRKPDIWIGFNQPVAGNSMTRDIGGSTLQYVVYRRAAGTGVWTNTGSQRTNQSGNGGLVDTIDFGVSGATFSASYNIYFRVPLGQVLVPAGIYLDTNVAVTMKLTDENGPTLGTTALGFRVSIPKDCRFSTDPSPIAVSYTSPVFPAGRAPCCWNVQFRAHVHAGRTITVTY